MNDDRVQAAEVRYGVTSGRIWNHSTWCWTRRPRAAVDTYHRTDTYHGAAWCITVVPNDWRWEAGGEPIS